MHDKTLAGSVLHRDLMSRLTPCSTLFWRHYYGPDMKWLSASRPIVHIRARVYGEVWVYLNDLIIDVGVQDTRHKASADALYLVRAR